jgi:N-acetylmuramoyl-L-alanine amidase
MKMKFIRSPNCTKSRQKDIDTIVIHYTGGETLDGAVSWFMNKTAQASAHYIIGRDGEIVQMVLNEDTAWHAGKSQLDDRKSVNQFSIGIELVNWGVLKKKNEEFTAWPENYNRKFETKKLGDPKLEDGKWWAPYSRKQINACIKLCSDLRKRYNIEDKNVVGHCDIAPGRKDDPGPLFPMKELRENSNPVGLDALYTNLDVDENEMLKRQEGRRCDSVWDRGCILKMGTK